MSPTPAISGANSYPDGFRHKRTPLLFDGRRSLLVVDVEGDVEKEVTPASLASDKDSIVELDDFLGQIGEHGSLVAAASRSVGGVGMYVHPDHRIWVYVDGSPLLVKRSGKWRAFPMTSLAAGLATMTSAPKAVGLVLLAAVQLSLGGHGGILAIAGDPSALNGSVQDKDRVDLDGGGVGELAAVHEALNISNPTSATLARLAAIDGATVVDAEGNIVAYGAVVASTDSVEEGARTAAARTLSNAVNGVTLKVSEDGPVTVFSRGEKVATLLG